MMVCRCHAHGVGHAEADPDCGYTVAGGWVPVPLCTGCMHNGCDANRPRPKVHVAIGPAPVEPPLFERRTLRDRLRRLRS